MTVEVLTDLQKANQKQMSKVIISRQAAHKADTRNAVIALVVALILFQGIDLFFATETVQHLIAEGSKKATIVVEDFFVYLVRLGAQCEAQGDSTGLCQLYIRVRHVCEQENRKDASKSELSEIDDASSSEIFHVVQHHNGSSIYDETLEAVAEGSDLTATLVKTVDTPAVEPRVANHPLLRLILHNPFFLQIFLPCIITTFALATQHFMPGRGNATASMAYFMLVFFFFARLFLQLY